MQPIQNENEYKKDITISDFDLLDSFIDTNCFIRLAVMKRLAFCWGGLNEKKRFALGVAFIEQFMALLESVEMLLFAMIEKGINFDKSLFSYYKSIQIRESESPNDKSILTLKNAFTGIQSNIEFCKLFGLDIIRLPVSADGSDFKISLDIIVDFLENYRRSTFPLVKSYNSIKHGMLVRLKHNQDQLYMEIILGMKSRDKSHSCATISGLTINANILNHLIKNAEMLSKNFQALCGIIKEGYNI